LVPKVKSLKERPRTELGERGRVILQRKKKYFSPTLRVDGYRLPDKGVRSGQT